MQTTTPPDAVTSPDAVTPAGAVARWQAPGTCGELVQGAIEGRDFLVNCPIALFSRATAHPDAPPGVWLRDGHNFGKIAHVVAYRGNPGDAVVDSPLVSAITVSYPGALGTGPVLNAGADRISRAYLWDERLPLSAVEPRLRGVLGISYQQFVRYVERYLADAAPDTTVVGSASSRPPGAVARPTEPVRAPGMASDPRRSDPPPNLPSPVRSSAGALPRFTYTPGQSSRDRLV